MRKFHEGEYIYYYSSIDNQDVHGIVVRQEGFQVYAYFGPLAILRRGRPTWSHVNGCHLASKMFDLDEVD